MHKRTRTLLTTGVFTTFSHSTPLHCAIHPLGTLFSFLSPPPPIDPCVLGLGVGVTGNAVLCSTVYWYQVCFLYILVHLKGLVQ